MKAPEQFDSLIDQLFALDAEHPYFGQTIEPEPEPHLFDPRKYAAPRYADEVERYVWEEKKHPRGQPKNKGEFARVPVSAKTPRERGKDQQQAEQSLQGQQPKPAAKHPHLERAEKAHAIAKAKGYSRVDMDPERLKKWDTTIRQPHSAADMPALIKAFDTHPHVKEVKRRLAELEKSLHGQSIENWSRVQHTGPDGKYTPQRQALHNEIADKTLPENTIAKPDQKPKLVVLLGMPGSGKSTAGQAYIDKQGVKFAVINTDTIKEDLPEYEGWNAAAVHEESSDVMKHDIIPRGFSKRHNMVFDVTGANPKKTVDIVNSAVAAGYDVSVVQVDTEPHTSTHRLMTRFLQNSLSRNGKKNPGRFVPPEYAMFHVDHNPKRSYSAIKDIPSVRSGVQLDNNVPYGSPAKVKDEFQR